MTPAAIPPTVRSRAWFEEVGLLALIMDARRESLPVAEEDRRRLRWQCRRGMLELDHLLGRFLDLGYAELSERERSSFLRLLAEPDQRLSDWLMSRSPPPDPELSALVQRILEVASEG